MYELTVKALDANGNFSTKTITVTVRPAGMQAPTNSKFQVQSSGNTKVSWTKPTGAVKYTVKRNARIVCQTRKTYCMVDGAIKRSDTVKVTAFDAQNRTATATATYAAPVTPPTPPSGSKLKKTVLFEISDWHFTAKARTTLYNFMLKLKRGGYKSVVITAYTDDLGNLQSDTTLSTARAKNVKRYLAYYMPKLKITISGLGRTNPAVPNLSEAQRKKNRRAVIEASK